LLLAEAGAKTEDGIGAGGDACFRRRQRRQATRNGSARAPVVEVPLLDVAAEMHVGRSRLRLRFLASKAVSAAALVGAAVWGSHGGASVHFIGAGDPAWR